jgi:Uma2 family endonuclease
MSTTTRDPSATGGPDAAPDPGLPARIRTVHTFARPLTPEEFMALPPGPYGEGKLELVDGAIVEMPPVAGDHSDIAHDLARALEDYVDSHGGEAFGRVRVELAFRLPLPASAGRAAPVRSPDVAFITADALQALPGADGGPVVPGKRLPRTFLACAPTIAAEVLSGHDYHRWADSMAKVEDYLSAGAALVWVLSPRHDTITVYDPAGGVAAPTMLKRATGDHLDGGSVLPGFRVPLASLFRPAG